MLAYLPPNAVSPSLFLLILVPTYTPLSATPPRILSPAFSSAFVSGLLIVVSFIFAHASPLPFHFPQSLWCVVGKAAVLCGGNEAHWRPGTSPAPLHTHTHTPTREVPLRAEGDMKAGSEHQDYTRQPWLPRSQQPSECACMWACVYIPVSSRTEWNNETISLTNLTGDEQQSTQFQCIT